MKFRLLFFVIVLAGVALAQPGDTLQRVDRLFSSWHNATPGMAVAISQNGNLIYHKAFGLASLELAVPNTVETIFECGSVSKQFTAAAILLLAKEGKLPLTDDVRKYVPELPVYDAPITLQHLLNHTSGLKDWGVVYGLAGWPRTSRVYSQELSFDIVFKQQSLNFTPGSQYSYSNSNYVLLVLVAERVSGLSLAEFTTTRFFEPLGMNDTRWRDNFRAVIPGRAQAYRKAGRFYELEMPFENVHGPGGLLTTTTDLLRWNRLLESYEVLGAEMAAVRVQPGKLSSGAEIAYAAGVMVGQVNGVKEISHSGATGGYRAWLAWYPSKKISVAILSNDGSFNPAGAGRNVAEIFFGKPNEERVAEPQRFVTFPAAAARRWEGLYRAPGQQQVIRIENTEGRLLVGGVPARPVHADTLYAGNLSWLILTGNGLVQRSPGRTQAYLRAEAPAAGQKELSAYVGFFRSEDADVAFRIEAREDHLLVHRKPGDAFRLEPAFKDGFHAGENGLFEFARDSRGRVTGFGVSLPRAQHIPFRRSAESAGRGPSSK